jgi:tetratricopeptide (TPR) repeat protein
MKTLFAGLFVSFALLTPAFVQAQQPTQPTQAELDRAKSYFETAQLEYNNGNYSEALEQYKKAYNIVQKPTILFNIGQCHRKLNNFQDASDSYKQFLKDDPDTQYKGEVEYKIAELEELLKNKQLALDYYKAYLKDKLDTDPNEVAAKQRIEILQKDLNVGVVGPDTEPVTNPKIEKKGFIAPIALGAVALSAFGLEAFFGIDAQGKRDQFDELSKDPDGDGPNEAICPGNGINRPTCVDDGSMKKSAILSDVFLGVAIASTAGAGFLAYTTSKKNKEESAKASSIQKTTSVQLVPTTTGGFVTFTFVPKP